MIEFLDIDMLFAIRRLSDATVETPGPGSVQCSGNDPHFRPASTAL